MSCSIWQSSLIMSGPHDRMSMKSAANGKYVVRWGGWASAGLACGCVEIIRQEEKKVMRLLSHPQHNLLRWEGGCEPMAEGESIMALLYPSGSRFTVPASSTSLCENKQEGRYGGGRWGWGWHEVLWPAVTRMIWAMLCTLTDRHTYTLSELSVMGVIIIIFLFFF